MTGMLDPWTGPASAYGARIDLLTLAFSALILGLSLPVFVLIAAFAVKYRRGRPANRKHPINQNVALEVSWALIPFLLMLGFYAWTTKLYVGLHRPPPGTLDISVVAKQWMWKFEHPGGQRELDELHVPAGVPVRLTMASQDVIHSLYIPALRLKQDVVPGRYTVLWFTADRPGIYRLTCAEFCGTDHSTMGGRFIVLSRADYGAWLDSVAVDMSLAAEGERLFLSHGCSGCHGPASTVHAPTLAGLYGEPVPLEGGDVVTADDQYIRDSILLPQSQIAAGYPHIMPTFQNLLSEDEVLKLVAYVKSLGDDRRPALP